MIGGDRHGAPGCFVGVGRHGCPWCRAISWMHQLLPYVARDARKNTIRVIAGLGPQHKPADRPAHVRREYSNTNQEQTGIHVVFINRLEHHIVENGVLINHAANIEKKSAVIRFLL
jgi:hypothetical protein